MTVHGEQARTSLLYYELRRLMRLRWIAAGVLAAVGLSDWEWLGIHAWAPLFMGVGAVLAAMNGTLIVLDRRLPRLHQTWPLMLAFAGAHLTVDLGCLTLLVLGTGGVESPLIGFYMFHMVFVSLLQTKPRVYVAAGLTLGTLAAGLWITRQWPSERRQVLQALGWLVAAAVTVYVANRITGAVYRRETVRARQHRRLRELMERVRIQQAVLMQQDKLAAMGQLAAGVAHEIANPLASMDSVLQLIQRNPSTPRPEMVTAMRDHIARIHRTVRQLTTFAHPGEGRMELVEVNAVVRAALDLLSFDRRLRQVKVEQHLDPAAGLARLNPHAMEQVLSNLFRNAIDAIDGMPQPRLVVRTGRRDGQCVIEVSDNGCGIPAEILPRIFEPFFTTKPVGQGTGLGLSISAKLVREQGGAMDVVSEPGKGAVFTIRLGAGEPVAPVPPQRSVDSALERTHRPSPAPSAASAVEPVMPGSPS
jgi:signal transduction histidine kinase